MTEASPDRPDIGGHGFVGLGAMGEQMARGLARSEVPLTVWNRTPEKAERLRADGVTVADTPAGAACGVVWTMLPDLPQVAEVLRAPDGLLPGWKAHGLERPILVVMGTVSPIAVTELAAELGAVGVRVVDAPVSGGVHGAREHRLSIMVGGAAEDVEVLDPYFRLMGSSVHHFGPVGSGSLAKACNQIVVAGTLTALGEAVALARAGGLDVAELLDALGGGLAGSEALRQKGPRLIAEDFAPPGGSAINQVKDLTFCLDAARSAGLELELTTLVAELYQRLVDHDHGDLDHSAVYLEVGARRR